VLTGDEPGEKVKKSRQGGIRGLRIPASGGRDVCFDLLFWHSSIPKSGYERLGEEPAECRFRDAQATHGYHETVNLTAVSDGKLFLTPRSALVSRRRKAAPFSVRQIAASSRFLRPIGMVTVR
jgi:hypothetical protein